MIQKTFFGLFILMAAVASDALAFVPTFGDFNVDGDYDLDDYSAYHHCLRGPLLPPVGTSCTESLFTLDGAIDLKDFYFFQVLFFSTEPRVVTPLFGNLLGPTSSDPTAFAVGDLEFDGDIDLVVSSSWNDRVSVYFNRGDGSMASPVEYTVGDQPSAVTMGDVDGDVDLDVVVTTSGNNRIYMLRNDGVGTLAAPVQYNAAGGPVALVLLDIDNDADLDVAVANQTGDKITIHRNTGAGVFTELVQQITIDAPRTLMADDVNGDHISDIVVVSPAGVAVLMNLSGLFQQPVNYASISTPSDVALADLDGDGDLDWATVNSSSDDVRVRFNTAGVFSSETIYPVGDVPVSIASEDVDNDGDFDLVAANLVEDAIAVLFNKGAGQFGGLRKFNTESEPSEILLAGLDGDAFPDLLSLHKQINRYGLLMNNADGSFASKRLLPTGIEPVALATGQLNDNETPDLMVATQYSSKLNVFWDWWTDGDLAQYFDYLSPAGIADLAVEDLNADGFDDLLMVGSESSCLDVLLGGHPELSNRIYDMPYSIRSMVRSDVDLDGDWDVVLALRSFSTPNPPGQLVLMRNNGVGQFAIETMAPSLTSPLFVADFDWEGDGDADFVVINGTGDHYMVRNDGGSAFEPVFIYQDTHYLVTNSAGGDLDGDGDSDFVFNWDHGFVYLINSGGGTFAATTVNLGSESVAPGSLDIADMDGDGFADIVATTDSGRVRILWSQGNGTFSPPMQYTQQSMIADQARVVDIDLDGDLDIPFRSVSGVWLLINDGMRQFSLFQITPPLVGNPSDLVVADVNSDEVPDLLVSSYYPRIDVLINTLDLTFDLAAFNNIDTDGLLAADFDGDETVDVIIRQAGRIVVYLNRQDSLTGCVANLVTPESVVVDDFNNDGSSDLACVRVSKDEFCVLMNEGHGQFSPDSISTHNIRKPKLADVDGDADLDIVGTYQVGSDSGLGVSINNGSDQYSVPHVYWGSEIGSASEVLIGDWNLDMVPDAVLLAGGDLLFYFNDGAGHFTLWYQLDALGFPASVVDMDGNGSDDLVLRQGSSGVIMKNLDGFGTGETRFMGAEVTALTTDDFDGDGLNDIATVNQAGESVSVLHNYETKGFDIESIVVNEHVYQMIVSKLNADDIQDVVFVAPGSLKAILVNANGNFTYSGLFAMCSIQERVRLVDVTDDGHDDLVYTCGVQSKTLVRVNNGVGAFGNSIELSGVTNARVVAVDDIDGDGDNDIVSSSTSSTSVFVNQAGGVFADDVVYNSGGSILELADLNGDDRPDIVLGANGSLRVRLNNGDGSFGSQASYIAGANFVDWVIVDIDNDDDLDVVASTHLAVSILRNSGDGTFASFASVSSDSAAGAIAAADIDGDGNHDLAITHYYDSNCSSSPLCARDYVSILRGDGMGGFVIAGRAVAGVASSDVYFADADSDGDLDLWVSSMEDFDISILSNDGYGRFHAPYMYFVGRSPQGIASGDFDGDGDSDLLASSRFDDSVLPLLNDGAGVFLAHAPIPAGEEPTLLAVGDIEHDGDLDVLVTDAADSTVNVLRNDGTGAFEMSERYEEYGSTANPVVLIDLDDDGFDDLVRNGGTGVGSYALTVHRGMDGGVFSGARCFDEVYLLQSIAAGDLTLDGFVDIVATSDSSNALFVFNNDTNGGFTLVSEVDLPLHGTVAMGDLDSDGDLDVIVARNGVAVLKNTGAGVFAAPVLHDTLPWYVDAVEIRDLDADGFNDVVGSSSGSDAAIVLINKGDGSFSWPIVLGAGFSPSGLVADDADGDGDIDAMVVNIDDDTVTVLKNRLIR